MHTVVETPGYLKDAEKLFSLEERAAIVTLVSKNPECGELMAGTGGFRKIRAGRDGMGKRGGARIIYIARDEQFPIFLIKAYPKNEMDNLSKAERNTLAKSADAIFAQHAAKAKSTAPKG